MGGAVPRTYGKWLPLRSLVSLFSWEGDCWIGWSNKLTVFWVLQSLLHSTTPYKFLLTETSGAQGSNVVGDVLINLSWPVEHVFLTLRARDYWQMAKWDERKSDMKQAEEQLKAYEDMTVIPAFGQ